MAAPTPPNTTGQVEGLNAFLKELRKLDKSWSDEVRRASMDIAARLVGVVKLRAQAYSPQAELSTRTIKAVRDRVPVVRVGGPTRVTRADGSKVAAGAVYFGADFGVYDQDKKQFPGAVSGGHVFWPTVRAERGNIVAEYEALIERVTREAFPSS